MDLRNQLPGNTFQYIVTTDGTHLFDGTGSLMTSLTITSITSSQVTQSFVSESFANIDNLKVSNLTASAIKFGFTLSDPTDPSGNIAIFATQSVLVVTSSGSPNSAGFGNGICFADIGFQTPGLSTQGFFDASQTPGRVTVWNPSFPALSSSITTITEVENLSGTTGSIQSQINSKQSRLVTGSLYPITSSFAVTSSFALRVISSSFATTATTATQLENRGTFPASISTAGNNGFNINDADGSTMGITGGGITIAYNNLSAVSPFEVRNTNNVTLSKIDKNGSFVCATSASLSGSLFGTASFANTASYLIGSTASIAPGNITTPVAWLNVTVSGSIYKLGLYQ